MKPTPADRLQWSVAGLALAGFAMLCWGCGHTREIIYPGRKVSPPRPEKHRSARHRLEPSSPTEPTTPPAPQADPDRQPDAPTAIDVPIIDRNES